MNVRIAVVPNTNNRYCAYSDGRIFDNINNRFIAQNPSKRGWLKCHIWYKDKRITIGVHRVIMMAFCGESNLTVNHKNGNKFDNSLENLEYMTVADQNKHRSYILKRGNRKSIFCKETNKVYETIKLAASELGIDSSHISACCKEKYGFKTVNGYHFSYC